MTRQEELYIRKVVKLCVAGLLAIAVISLVAGGLYTVPAGQRAVLLTFGKPDMEAKGEGLHFKLPLVQSVKRMDVKTLIYSQQVQSASTDLQVVGTKVALNYRLVPEQAPAMYKEVGMDYEATIILPVIHETVKSCTAMYKAEELITKREAVKAQIDSMLKSRLVDRHIVVETVSITDFDFSENFNAAIEAKVTAEQTALAAKNKLEQVKYEAEQTVAKAKAEAEAIRIQAEAITSQGGKDYVQLKAVEKWDGKMPVYTGPVLPFLDVTQSEDPL